MKRLSMIFVAAFTIFGFGMAGFAGMQDSGTPEALDVDCATPAAMGTPEVGATPASGTPVVADPCATPESDEAGEEVTVEMVDIAFKQTEITIPADTDVTFHFVNEGNLQHDFNIDDPEVYSGMLNGGEESELQVNLPAGEYEFYCTVPGHKEAGMVGTLIVE